MYRRFNVEEGDYDTAEGFERGPGVNFGMLIDRFADLGESVELEDFGREEVLQVLLAILFICTKTVHTVIMRVFEGGDGSTSGGRSERSSESGDLVPDDARERCGDGMVASMFATKEVAVLCFSLL